MDQETLQQFRAEVISRRNLPTIPTVLTRVLALVDDQATNARQLVEVIEHDQALTGRMLRLANSAFFGQSRRVATIPRAILLLGFSTVRNMALGVKVWEALAVGVSVKDLEALWDHSVAVAVASKMLATRLLEGDPNETFTAGLLHDVGRLIILARFREKYWEAVNAAGDGEPVDAAERVAFGVDHAEVGGWLLEGWHLPRTIVDAVRQHHAAPGAAGVAWLLGVADALVHATDLATGTVGPQGAELLDALAGRGITAEFWETVIPDLRENPLRGTGRR